MSFNSLLSGDVKADTYRDQCDEHVQTSPDFDHCMYYFQATDANIKGLSM
jgi:hypothetical protein